MATPPGWWRSCQPWSCAPTYKPRYNKNTGQSSLRADKSKCLHYYFYFIDEELGLLLLRVPTWCPFGVQVYFNGRNLQARTVHQLRHAFCTWLLQHGADVELVRVIAGHDDIKTTSQYLHARVEDACRMMGVSLK